MKKQKTRKLRLLSMGAITLLLFISGVAGKGPGSFSALGWKIFYYICPLGILETTLAGRHIIPRLLIDFLFIAGLTVLLGRMFCGWICPVPLVRKLFTNKIDDQNDSFQRKENKKQLENNRQNSTVQDRTALEIVKHKEYVKSSTLQETAKVKKESTYGLPILGASLFSSAIFGFPVFCLICPIGLTFATLFALMKLLRFNEPTIDLIIFPLVILVELVLLKKWCSRFCPLGALLGLFSRFNRRLVPTVDQSKCLEESRGVRCHECQKVCSFNIDIKGGSGTGHISNCSKCRECATSCPVHAITFPWKKKPLPEKENSSSSL